MSDTNVDESPWAYAIRKEAEREIQKTRAELRDRFAMAALTGLLAHRNNAPSFISTHQDQRARMAYEYADAMMKARDNKSTDQ